MNEQGRETTSLPSDVSVLNLAETLVAFANTQGGMLRLALGNQSIEDAIDRIREASLLADPRLILPIPTTAHDDCLEVVIPRGLSHVFALDGRYLAREGGANRPLSSRELRRLMYERGDISFEEQVNEAASFSDLDWQAVEIYTNRLMTMGISGEAILAQRGCIVKRGDRWIPTNAGLLLFGKDPQRFVRGAYITAASFVGTEMSDQFSRKDLTGTLPEQIRGAEAFLAANLERNVVLGANMERTEQFEYPMEAARELVVNAVSHRDYSIFGDGIRLFLFADRMEVNSPGGLAGPVTLENIIHERFSRNSIIVQVLSDMGFIERLGYGVDRVIALMNERKLPEPEFAETSGGFEVCLYNSPLPVDVPIPEGGMLDYALNPRQETAMSFLSRSQFKRITNKDLQELFPEVHPETIRRDLADLVIKGLLTKMGEKRGSFYVAARRSA